MTRGSTTQGLPTVQEREQRFEQMKPDQAVTRITTFPAQMAYEARIALQQVREASELDGDVKAEIIEPLAKAVGWAEALSYAVEKSTEKEAVRHLIRSGQFQPTNGS